MKCPGRRGGRVGKVNRSILHNSVGVEQFGGEKKIINVFGEAVIVRDSHCGTVLNGGTG